MAFIRDHNLTFVRLYEDNLSPEGVSDETKDRMMKDSAAGLIDVVIVRDISVIAPDDEILEKIDDAFPLIIGAEDLYYPKTTPQPCGDHLRKGRGEEKSSVETTPHKK